MKSRLRTKILFSVSLIIFVVLGISTFIHIQELKRDYLEAIGWRSEAMAQGLLKNVPYINRLSPSSNIQETLRTLSPFCHELYELNKEKNVTHVSVIDASGTIAAHNNIDFWNTAVASPTLLDHLQQRKQTTLLNGKVYHTLVPIFGTLDVYIGTIDIGVSKENVDQKVRAVCIHSITLFIVFLFVSFFSLSLLMHVILTKPVRNLVSVGQQLANGQLVYTTQGAYRGDEIGLLGAMFSRISIYLQHLTDVASRIAIGILDNDVHVRSKHDTLGKAVHDMLYYLKHVAAVATKITVGDLTETVQLRSTSDSFGRVIQTMTESLRTLIVQIRTSAEQITKTGEDIASLAMHDIQIVQNVNNAMGHVMATMHKMDNSVEEVAQDMDMLSSSVEETSASVSQMTSSVSSIATQTNNLTNQAHQTIESLNETLNSLETVVESTDVSQKLTQETIQDAFEGQQAVEQVMGSMKTIQHAVMTAVEAINGFEKRSQEIDTIVEVIQGITEQTSMLALNASIIAAQAGEYGRGFAVVADEIRDLANGVRTSTTHIASILNTLQQETQQVVQTIHSGAEHVEQGMEQTRHAQTTLQKITNSAQRASSVVTEITESLHGLRATSRRVSLAMEEVNMMTGMITVATEEHQASTQQIHQAIRHITDMTGQIHSVTAEQLTGVRQVLEAARNMTCLIEQNLESSHQISQTTETFASQADMLLNSVARFKIE